MEYLIFFYDLITLNYSVGRIQDTDDSFTYYVVLPILKLVSFFTKLGWVFLLVHIPFIIKYHLLETMEEKKK